MCFELSYVDLYQYFLNLYYKFPDNTSHKLDNVSFMSKKDQKLQESFSQMR